jgi:hypothetical protein
MGRCIGIDGAPWSRDSSSRFNCRVIESPLAILP